MPSYTFTLDTNFQPLIDFKKHAVSYFNIEVENFDGPFLEMTFGDPSEGAQVELRVPNQCSITRDDRPLKGVLWARAQTGTPTINIMIW